MTKRERAEQLVRTLQEAGHEAFFVGGSVRSLLLGRTPKDYDIVTSATPDEIAALFPSHVPVGRAFGVLLVSTEDGNFEIATYRSEHGYTDRRRPDTVEWTDAKTDVRRRDFTINGLLYDPVTERVTDSVGGQRDLALGLVRAIGSPRERLTEDPLRILRAIRLRNQLGFQYDKATFDALGQAAAELVHISGERVRNELNLMLDGPFRSRSLRDLAETGVLEVILPEIDRLRGTPQPTEYHREGDVFAHSLRAVAALSPDAPLFLVWAVLLHDVGKPETLGYQTEAGRPQLVTYHHAEVSAQLAERILRRLRFPRREIETITWMIAHHMSLARIEQMRPAKREAYVLDPRFPWLLELHKADAAGTVPADLSLYAHNLKLYQRMKADHARQKQEASTRLVNGHDLQRALGLEPGPNIGQILEELRDAQLSGQLRSKTEAIELARRLAARYTRADDDAAP